MQKLQTYSSVGWQLRTIRFSALLQYSAQIFPFHSLGMVNMSYSHEFA